MRSILAALLPEGEDRPQIGGSAMLEGGGGVIVLSAIVWNFRLLLSDLKCEVDLLSSVVPNGSASGEDLCKFSIGAAAIVFSQHLVDTTAILTQRAVLKEIPGSS